MLLDSAISGRKERRLPIVLVVKLVCIQTTDTVDIGRSERTYTDNISPHGLRVQSTSRWQPGEEAEITPVNGGTPVRGEVVYCQKVDDSRFFIGLKFPQSAIPWAALKRFDGLVLSHQLDWNFAGARARHS